MDANIAHHGVLQQMVNMGAAITLLMKKWVDAHSLTTKEKVVEYIPGTNGTAV